MKLSLIIEDLQSKLPILIRKYYPNLSPEEATKLITSLSELDPTPNKQYLDWLVNQHKRNNIRIPEDNDKILQMLTKFHQIKPRLQIKDINQYKSPGDVARTIDGVNPTSNRELKLKGRKGELVLPDGAKYLGRNEDYQVVQILTPEAAGVLASGTEWCVANAEIAEEYLDDGPLYLIYENNERAYLLHYESEQLMDIWNNSADDVWDILFAVESLTGYIIKDSPIFAYKYAIDIGCNRWPEGEPAIIRSPKFAYKYARDIIDGRWPEAEPYIMKDSKYASKYADNIIDGRWPEAEPYIMKNPRGAHYYASNVIEDRWPEAEPYIMKDPESAYQYAAVVIYGRWPEAEPYIMKDPKSAYEYANYVIEGGWPEAEPTIMKDPESAYYYARNVIEGRWPEAEPTIMKDPRNAYMYADSVIKGRWPEAEPIIMQDKQLWNYYVGHYGIKL